MTSIIHSLDQDLDNYIQLHNEVICDNKRNTLKLLASGSVLASVATLGLFASTPALAKNAFTAEREVKVYTPHFTETTRIVYWVPGEGYIRESLKELSWALRDRRDNTARVYDPHVLDQLFALRLQLDYSNPTHVICGYRSAGTNAMLRRTMRGVAKDSLHMKAKALDIRMPGRSNSDIYRTALVLNAGGVGHYARSNFTHIDSGSVRTWRG